MFKSWILKISMLGFAIFLQSCYNFTGSSLKEDVNTCFIDNFPNYSSLQNPNLSQDFSIALQDRFTQRTKLELISEKADINLEGEIVDYIITPENNTANDTDAQNRLTIKVRVRYVNEKYPEESFDRTFSDYDNFSANDVEPSENKVEEVYNRIIDQIFNAIVANW